MHCHYINLASAEARRRSFEQSFGKAKTNGWDLVRFEALDTQYVADHDIPGKITGAEKGCFLSHRAIAEAQPASAGHFMVIEDDTIFGAETCAALDRFIKESNVRDWDIIFTYVTIPNIISMSKLIKRRRRLSASDQLGVIDLSAMNWHGTSAYVVNGAFLERFRSLFASFTVYDLAYDNFLRWLIQERKIRALAIFPFLTCVSSHSTASHIQAADGSHSDLLWDAFGRLVWNERDLDEAKAMMAAIDEELGDEESRLFGQLFGALVSRRYKHKMPEKR